MRETLAVSNLKNWSVSEDNCSCFIFADSNYLLPFINVNYNQVTINIHTKEHIFSLLKLTTERVIYKYIKMSAGLISYTFLKFQFIYFSRILVGLTCLDTEGTESVACYILGTRHEHLLLSLTHKNNFDLSSGGPYRSEIIRCIWSVTNVLQLKVYWT